MVQEKGRRLVLQGTAERITTKVAAEALLEEETWGEPLPLKVKEATEGLLGLLSRPVDFVETNGTSSIEIPSELMSAATQALLYLAGSDTWYGKQAGYMFAVAEEGQRSLVDALAAGELMQNEVTGQLPLFGADNGIR